MAEVQLAIQRGPAGFEKLVVVKLVHENLASQKPFVDMLLDEARIAALVKHPNVVDIYDLGEADGRYFIAMEYLEGEPLLAVLRAGRDGDRLDVLSTARLIADTAEGLDAAHELRSIAGDPIELVHHDVSLGNIVVLYNGAVKLVDFGVAKASQSTSVRTKVQGKFGYMAPEKLRGEPGDRRSDIWSLGCVLWEALTLKRLFRGGNDSDTMQQVLDSTIHTPSSVNGDVSADFDPVVMRALERDPSQRYATAKFMAADLEDVLRKHGYAAKNDLIARYMQATFKTHIAARKKLLQQVSSKGRASAEVLEAAFHDGGLGSLASGTPIVPGPPIVPNPPIVPSPPVVSGLELTSEIKRFDPALESTEIQLPAVDLARLGVVAAPTEDAGSADTSSGELAAFEARPTEILDPPPRLLEPSVTDVQPLPSAPGELSAPEVRPEARIDVRSGDTLPGVVRPPDARPSDVRLPDVRPPEARPNERKPSEPPFAIRPTELSPVSGLTRSSEPRLTAAPRETARRPTVVPILPRASAEELLPRPSTGPSSGDAPTIIESPPPSAKRDQRWLLYPAVAVAVFTIVVISSMIVGDHSAVPAAGGSGESTTVASSVTEPGSAAPAAAEPSTTGGSATSPAVLPNAPSPSSATAGSAASPAVSANPPATRSAAIAGGGSATSPSVSTNAPSPSSAAPTNAAASITAPAPSAPSHSKPVSLTVAKPHHDTHPAAPPVEKANPDEIMPTALQAFMRGDNKTAISLYKHLLQTNPGYAPAWRFLGVVYEKIGDRAGARTAYQKYLQLAPSAPNAPDIREKVKGL